MGNYASCALGGGDGRVGSGGAAKVVFPGGEIRYFHEPVKAAELMLETPNFFLVNSKSLQIGRRFDALSADEDLEIGHVYALFPMQRLRSVVATTDVAPLFMAVNSAVAKKKASGAAKVRVSPEVAEMCTKEAAAPVRLDLQQICSPQLKHRRSVCRSRMPVLETIVEEPVN